jgi:GntR family transcriptional regulator
MINAIQSNTLHAQVLEVLRARIRSGEWKPRQPLPGEVALSQELGVSIGTVRKAMDHLSREKIVIRERGRGTFVRGDHEGIAAGALSLYSRARQRLNPQITLVASAILAASASESKALGLLPNLVQPRQVASLYREWKLEGHVLCKEQIRVDANRFPDLAQRVVDAGMCLFPIYEEAFGVGVDKVEWSIGSETPSDVQRIDFKLQPSDALLQIDRTAYDAKGSPVELCRIHADLSRCHLTINQ